MWPIEDYITCKTNTIVQYISTRPIYKIYVEKERMQVSLTHMNWREQAGIEFEGDLENSETRE